MQDLTFRAFRKVNIYFWTIKEREKIISVFFFFWSVFLANKIEKAKAFFMRFSLQKYVLNIN